MQPYHAITVITTNGPNHKSSLNDYANNRKSKSWTWIEFIHGLDWIGVG